MAASSRPGAGETPGAADGTSCARPDAPRGWSRWCAAGKTPRPLRARDVAAQLRALLPHQEPAALGDGGQAARPAQLVRGAAAGRQRASCARSSSAPRILTEEQVNQTRFDKYVESYLEEGRRRRPLRREAAAPVEPRRPGLTLLRESLEDLHLVLTDLVKPGPHPLRAPSRAVGKILYREIRRSHLLALLIDKKFKPIHDRITNHAVAGRHPQRSRDPPSASRRPRSSWSSSGSCTTSTTPTPSRADEENSRTRSSSSR